MRIFFTFAPRVFAFQFNQDFSCEARGMLGGGPLAPSFATLRGASPRNNCPAEPKTYNSKGQQETCTNVCP